MDEPENIRAAAVEYANSSDKMQNFINDCLVEKKGCNIAIKDLYEKYEEWCNDNGFYTENSKQIAINGRKNEVRHYEISKIYEKGYGTVDRVQRNG